jgi:hypothetical protein
VTAVKATCGTEAGYSRHRRAGETPCPSCVTAHTEARRDRRYGLKPGQWLAMYAAQGGRCMVCGSTPSSSLHVDHDHNCCPRDRSCGECVRGLVCTHCNRMFGAALDSVEILRRAVIYLEGNLRQAPAEFLGDLSKKGIRKPRGPLYKARNQ